MDANAPLRLARGLGRRAARDRRFLTQFGADARTYPEIAEHYAAYRAAYAEERAGMGEWS